MPDTLSPDQSLERNQSLTSASGRFALVYQADGDLVLYKIYGSTARKRLWSTKTGKNPVGKVVLQEGNLVVLDARGKAVWTSDTPGHPGSRLVVQDDGNVVIYDAGGAALWASGTSGQKFARTGPAARGDTMRSGEILAPDQPIQSAGGHFSLVFESDGDLVLYKSYRNQPRSRLWSAKTAGQLAEVCVLQDDGNLVIYDRDAVPLWSSRTWNRPGSRLVVQDDGNAVIYDASGAAPWATWTAGQKFAPTGPEARGERMRAGDVLNPGQSITSASKAFTLLFQADGDLVLYKTYNTEPRTRLWAAGTAGKPAEVCVMQEDGNLVIYDRDGPALWSSKSWGHAGSALVAQDDGNVVIYDRDGKYVWSTATAAQAPAPVLAEPYALIQTRIAETRDQILSYLVISETQDPGRDLDPVTEEEASAGVLADMTALGKTRVVHISGMKLVWDSAEPASVAMMAYNNGSDIGELNLYADTVVVREPIVVPGGDVRIFARRLEFGERGRIVTEPDFVQQTPIQTGAPGARGARGGGVSLLVKPEGGEAWPDELAEFASGLHIESERPDDLPLISTRGGAGQKGGPGGTSREPRAFAPAESRDRAWFMARMANTPVWRPDGGEYHDGTGATVRVGALIGQSRWIGSVPSMGGGDVLRVIIRPGFGDDRGFLPINDWQGTPKNWPPLNGADATPAGKPGLGGRGGDLVSTLKVAAKAHGGVAIEKCVDLAGGKSGEVGDVATGGDPDSPGTYRVQTVDVYFADELQWIFGSFFEIDRIQNAFETVSLGKGKSADPLRPDRERGDAGVARDAGHPLLWLHPFQVRAVIQYAKDLFLKGDRDKSRALLAAYRGALDSADASDTWPAGLEIWRDEMHELAAETRMILHRLEDGLDFFGNPVGWAPVLSLRSNVQIYTAEIDDAIRQLWFAYRVRTAFDRVRDATKDLRDAVAALEGGRKNMEASLKEAQDRVPGLLTQLRDKQKTYVDRKAELDRTRDRLLVAAKSDEQRKRIITAVFGAIDAACTIIPVGQPYLKAAGSTLNSVSAFFSGDPEDRSKALAGMATTATSLKTDLESYKTDLTSDVSKKLEAIEKESADAEVLAADQEAALTQVDTKVGLYKDLRSASAAVSAKEQAIAQKEGELDGLVNQIRICTGNLPPVPKPPAQDTEHERREMLREIIDEANKALPKTKEELEALRKELPTLKEALGEKRDALARGEQRYDWAGQVRSAKAEISGKKREFTEKKANQSANIERWQRALGNASDGLGKLDVSIKQFTMPADQVAARVDAELAKLEAGDPLYTELKQTVADLDLEVTGLKGSLEGARSEVSATTRGWLDNRRQTRALSGAIRGKSAVLDHFAVQFVDKMKTDAYERLIRYQYYIQKSFEYLFLAPCPYVDYQLTQMNDRVLELLETSGGKPLTPDDIALMKTLFRAPIVQIAQQIVDQMQSKVSSRAARIPVSLASHLMPTLNAGRPVRCTLVEAFGLPLSNADQRIDTITLVKAVLEDGGALKPESLRVTIRHLGPSIVRGMSALYCFSAGRPGGRSHWGFTWKPASQEAFNDPKQNETTAILQLILGLRRDANEPGEMVSNLSEYFPGIFSDFEIAVEWVPDGAKVPIRELHFEITMPYQQTDDQCHLLHVKTSDGLKPLIDCGQLADDFKAPSPGGYGDFFRLFGQGTSVYVAAPLRYGARGFRGWVSSVTDTEENLKRPLYVFTLDQARTLTATFE